MAVQPQIKRNWTFRELYRSGLRLRPNKGKKPNKSPRIRLVRSIPFVGVKTVLYQVRMDGVTQKAVHSVNFLVSGLDIKTTDQNNITKYKQISDKGKSYWVEKPSANNSTIKVRCTCKDYYFTWGWWNFKQGGMFGRQQKPYKRKTPPPPRGRAYRNPNKYAGTCKHCDNGAKALINNGHWVN